VDGQKKTKCHWAGNAVNFLTVLCKLKSHNRHNRFYPFFPLVVYFIYFSFFCVAFIKNRTWTAKILTNHWRQTFICYIHSQPCRHQLFLLFHIIYKRTYLFLLNKFYLFFTSFYYLFQISYMVLTKTCTKF